MGIKKHWNIIQEQLDLEFTTFINKKVNAKITVFPDIQLPEWMVQRANLILENK